MDRIKDSEFSNLKLDHVIFLVYPYEIASKAVPIKPELVQHVKKVLLCKERIMQSQTCPGLRGPLVPHVPVSRCRMSCSPI